MKSWIERAGFFLLAIFAVLYIAAKIHFFTRYWSLGAGKYLEEHRYFWMGMTVVGGAAALLSWIKNRIEKPKSD